MSKKIERTLPVSAAVTIVNGLLDAVHKDITIKTFVNKNLNSFTIVKLGQVFETALLPFDCHPRNEKFSEEQEA